MNRSSVHRPWTGRETNSGELFVELGAELTVADAIKRAALGQSFDLDDHYGEATDDDFDHEDPTNVIGMDVDEAFQLDQAAKVFVKETKSELARKRREAENLKKQKLSETEET